MLVSSHSGPAPSVSIILPTYNRAKFLPQAFESIRAQEWTDWELIVVDDGSTDDTRALVAELTHGWEQPVRYFYQQNQGAYGARNTGLDAARGTCIAFYDSDDLWLPHHLKDCANALIGHPDVDWVYGACRIVDLTSGTQIAPSTFYEDNRPRAFLRLQTKQSGPLKIVIDSGATACQILNGLMCGLQNSVIRAAVFGNYRFQADLRNEAEDQVFAVWALATGRRLAYFTTVHVEYGVHDTNSSMAGDLKPLATRLRLFNALINGFERLRASAVLGELEQRALNKRLSREYFWHIGYELLWNHGRRAEGLEVFRKAIWLWPWDWRYWKTYLLSWLRYWPRGANLPDNNGSKSEVLQS